MLFGSSLSCCGELRRPSWGQDFKPFRGVAFRGMPEVTDRRQLRDLQREAGQVEADSAMDPYDGTEERREGQRAEAVREKAAQDVLGAYRERRLQDDDRPLSGKVVHNPAGGNPFSGKVVPDQAAAEGTGFTFREPTPAP